jgi:cysteine sulfinate desulfinase/cysteine desulfurase-like protein
MASFLLTNLSPSILRIGVAVNCKSLLSLSSLPASILEYYFIRYMQGFEWQETAVPRRNTRELREDRHEPREDRREPREDRREPREDRREDRREPREDRRETREPREDRRETREPREDRRETREPREAHHSPIYLDTAAGVPMQRPALAAWLAAAAAPPDPTAAARAATALAKAMATEGGFELGENAIANMFAPDAPNSPNSLDFRSYSVSWAGGVAEANCAIITGAVRRYAAGTRHLPHVVTSAGDPPSVLACCRALLAERACELTILPLTCVGGAGAGGAGAGGAGGAGAGACAAGAGTVDPARVRAALRENTCLVTIAAASADSGVVNDMRAIAAAAHAGARARPAAPGPYERAPAAERRRPPPARIPVHSDVSALIGAGTFSPVALGLDAWTAGFAGVGAPAALAALGVRPAFAAGYGLAPYTLAASALASDALASGALAASALAASAPDASEQCHATALGSASEPSTLTHLGPALAAAVAAWGAPRPAPADVAAARDALAAALAAVPNISFWFESPRLPSVLVVGHPAFGASTVRDLARSAIVGRPSAALVAAFGDFGDSAESRALRNSLRISLAAPITQIEVARVVAEIEHAAGERQK